MLTHESFVLKVLVVGMVNYASGTVALPPRLKASLQG